MNKWFAFRDGLTWFIRVIVFPSAFAWGGVHYFNAYFEAEQAKTATEQAKIMVGAQIKAMCIQKHACGDDCQDI